MRESTVLTRHTRASAVALGVLLVLAGMVMTAEQSSAAPTLWSGTGPGTTTVLSDGATSNPQFQYAMNPAGLSTTRTWSFSTTADVPGPVTLGYDYGGFHAFFAVTAFLRAFVTRAGNTTFTPLVDAGPANCCSSPSNGFSYIGTTTLNLQPGDIYGFEFGGQNFDSNNVLNGTLTVDVPTPLETTLTADPAGQGLFALRARLTETATGDPVPGQTVVMRTTTGDVCQATTDANGFASCDGLAASAQIILDDGYTASFAGTSAFAASTSRAGLLVNPTTTTTVAANTTTTARTTNTTVAVAAGAATTTSAPLTQLPATGSNGSAPAWGAVLLFAALGLHLFRRSHPRSFPPGPDAVGVSGV